MTLRVWEVALETLHAGEVEHDEKLMTAFPKQAPRSPTIPERFELDTLRTQANGFDEDMDEASPEAQFA